MSLESPYRKAGVKEKIEKDAHEAGSKELVDFVHGFGVKKEDLAPDEAARLEEFIAFGSKRLMNAMLDTPDAQGLSPEDTLARLDAHAETFSSFVRHDLIHAAIAYNLNQHDPRRRNSLVPEFIRQNRSETQAIAEEYPALLWTPSFNGKPPLIEMMEGRGENLGKMLEEYAAEHISDSEITATLRQRMAEFDPADFNSLMGAFSELVVTGVKVDSIKEKQRLPKDEFDSWMSAYDEHLAVVRQEFEEELQNLGEMPAQEQSKERETLRLVLEKAKKIFDGYSTNKRIVLEQFETLIDPLNKRFGGPSGIGHT